MSAEVILPPASQASKTVELSENLLQLRELTAQETMADMAIIMAAATTFSIIITALGVLFVKRTLDASWKAVAASQEATEAARKAVSETTRIGEAQTRAYLATHASGLIFDNLEVGRLAGRSTNTGMTPALDVSISASGALIAEGVGTYDLVFEQAPDRAIGAVPGQSHRYLALTTACFPENLRGLVGERKVHCRLELNCVHQDVFGEVFEVAVLYETTGYFENGDQVWFQFER